MTLRKLARNAPLTIAMFLSTSVNGAILYVDDSAFPNGDGTSWNTAYIFLQDALTNAAALEEQSIEIRIAQGLYIPDRSEASSTGTGDRFASFELTNGITLKGGFRGLSTKRGENPDDRDPQQFKTILSGDLLQNDTGPFVNNEENSLHVISIVGTQYVDDTGSIDGVIVERGNANVFGDKSGGGLYALYAIITVRNCTFRWNNAINRGGGVRITWTDALIEGCEFTKNLSLSGGALDQNVGVLQMNDCSIVNNNSANGGGICSDGGRFYFDNCNFKENVAIQKGGAIITETSNYEIRNSVFLENEAGQQGGAIYSPQSDGWIEFCVFESNYAEIEGGGVDLASNNTTVLNCQFLRNTSRWAGAASTVASVDFVNCLFVGNEATDNAGVLLSDGPATMTNCTVVDNSAGQDGGIIYTQCCTPTLVTNCIFVGNQVGAGGDLFWNLNDVAHCLVQEPISGEGNIIGDPQFVDPANGDYRLMPGSICIDRGYNPILTEIVKYDLVGNYRFVDDPESPDTGVPDFVRPMIDFGAYEFCRGDADRNGVVNVFDLLLVLSSWNQNVRLPDTDGDGDVDEGDVTTVLSYWGVCE